MPRFDGHSHGCAAHLPRGHRSGRVRHPSNPISPISFQLVTRRVGVGRVTGAERPPIARTADGSKSGREGADRCLLAVAAIPCCYPSDQNCAHGASRAAAGPLNPCPLYLVLHQSCTADNYSFFCGRCQHPFTGMPHPVRHAALRGDVARQPYVIQLVILAYLAMLCLESNTGNSPVEVANTQVTADPLQRSRPRHRQDARRHHDASVRTPSGG